MDAYLTWGTTLLSLNRDLEASGKFEQAILIDPARKPALADRYYSWGNALADQNRIEEAIEKYREAIRLNRDHACSCQNVAYYLGSQGRFREAWSEWERAAQAYRRGVLKAKEDGDADYFRYFGSVLKKLGEPNTEEVYQEGLRLDPHHAGILSDLVDLYLEQEDELVLPEGKPDREGRTIAHARARETYRKAEQMLRKEESKTEDTSTLLQLGQLYLSMEEYDEAEKRLLNALDRDKESVDVYKSLGVLYTRKENFRKAIECFREALRRDPDDLAARSSLAEAYLKAQIPDKAEIEYKKVLGITAVHVESEIGLGQVYTTLAESGTQDLYEEAVHHFTRAIQIGKASPSSASKRLKRKEWAAVYYSTGYAKVKLYDASKPPRTKRLLRQALQDFDRCLEHDRDYHQVERARQRILERLRPSLPDRLLEKVGTIAILALSAFVFVLTQVSFFLKGSFGDLRYYVPTTFGSLILMIAGFYLSRLLKLKGTGIELEESSVDQTLIPAPEILEFSVSIGAGGNPSPCRRRMGS